MVLSLQQVKERIRNPESSSAIFDAQRHENRIKLHTKAVDDRSKASPYFSSFLDWVKNGIKLPSDKMQAFEGMCQFPLATNALCNSVFDEYEKIFTAQDSFFDVELMDDSLKVDFKRFLQDADIDVFFKEVVFKAYQKQPACVLVVDLPNIQITQRPRPYVNKISINAIVDIGLIKNSRGQQSISYLIYKISDKKYIAIDDASYRLLEETESDGNNEREYFLLLESTHGLGYTPATFIAQTPLYDDEDMSPVARKTQMSDVIGDLDWLLFFKIAKRLYETYGPFPIMTIPDGDCSFEDAEGHKCQGGYIAYTDSYGLSSHKECPVCKKNSVIGPGTIFTRPTPKSKDDPELGEAVTITPPHVLSLEYINKHIDYLEWEIYANCVGSADETVTKEAVNAKQVQVTVEGKRNVFLRLKREFEATKKFLVDTMGRLRYGPYFLESTVNFGEQFLLYTVKDLADQIKVFKDAELPEHAVHQKKKELMQREYKNNPYALKRAELLDMLEPFPDKSIDQCIDMMIDQKYPEKFIVKLDFNTFISKFELSNGDIVQWGSAISLNKKIELLTEILTNYGKEYLSRQQPTSEQSGPRANGRTVAGPAKA